MTPSARIKINKGIGLRTFGTSTTMLQFEYLSDGET